MTGSPGSETVTEPCSSKRASSTARSTVVAERRRHHRVLRTDQRPQPDLLLPGQPAELGRLAAELAAATLDQRQHLQHAVVDGPGEPGPLGAGGRDPLGGRQRDRRALQRLTDEPDDRAADHQQEDVAVVALRDVVADHQVGHAQHRRGDQAAGPAPVDRPGEHRAHHPEPGQGGVEVGALEPRRHDESRPGHGQVEDEERGRPPGAVGVGPDRHDRPRDQGEHRHHRRLRVVEVVPAIDVEGDHVDRQHDPQHGQGAEEPVLHGARRRVGVRSEPSPRGWELRTPSSARPRHPPARSRPRADRPSRPAWRPRGPWPRPPWPCRRRGRRTPGRRAA